MSNGQVTILFLAANPTDTTPLRLGEELREIKEALRHSEYRSRFDLEEEVAARIDDLRRAMLAHNPNVVHIAGHGEIGAIILEDRAGLAQSVSADALSAFFALFPSVQCIVLNACYSKELGSALAQTVPYVVGMQAGIQDRSAIQFAVAFYDAVGAGQPYERAFAIAKASLALEGTIDALLPVLHLGRSASGAAQAVNTTRQQAKLTRLTGQQFSQFQKALLEAYDLNSLKQMVRVQLEVNLDEIASSGSLRSVVFDLISWAQRQGALDALLDGALAGAPNNPVLREYAESVRQK